MLSNIIQSHRHYEGTMMLEEGRTRIYDRIGPSEISKDEFLAWVVDVTQMELVTLSAGQLVDLSQQMVKYAWLQVPPQKGRERHGFALAS